MAFNISTVCAKCGRQPPEVTSFRLVSMTESICVICEPEPLSGSCPTCEGHGEVGLFTAWCTLNRVVLNDRSRFDVLRAAMPACRTKKGARELLAKEHCDVLYPLLPDWLPETGN